MRSPPFKTLGSMAIFRQAAPCQGCCNPRFGARKTFMRTWVLPAMQLLTLSLMAFLLLRLFPGGPFDDLAQWPLFLRQKFEEQYALRSGVLESWLTWLGNFFGWNFPSLLSPGRTIGEVFLEKAPYTLRLALGGLLLIIMQSLLLTVLHLLLRQHRSFLTVLRGCATVPVILLAPLVVFFFDGVHPIWAFWVVSFRPTFVLSELLCLEISSLLQQPWVQTHRAYSVTSGRVMRLGLSRLSISTLLGYLASLLVQLANGSFLVEIFFNRPGLGQTLIQAFLERDLFFLATFLFFMGAWVLFLQKMSAEALQWLDPRTRSHWELS